MTYIIHGTLAGIYMLAMAIFTIIVLILIVKDIRKWWRGETPDRQLWGQGRQHETR